MNHLRYSVYSQMLLMQSTEIFGRPHGISKPYWGTTLVMSAGLRQSWGFEGRVWKCSGLVSTRVWIEVARKSSFELKYQASDFIIYRRNVWMGEEESSHRINRRYEMLWRFERAGFSAKSVNAECLCPFLKFCSVFFLKMRDECEDKLGGYDFVFIPIPPNLPKK